MIPFIDLQSQRARIDSSVQRAIAAVLAHGAFVMGPEVSRLEEELAHWAGVPHAVTCASGTDALVMALMARNIRPGDAVFVPSFTFVATAEAVALVGATPVFVDVTPGTLTMDPASLDAAVAACRREGWGVPRAVIPVDLFGQPADYAAIGAVADREGLWILADAAQSFGARLGETPVGSLAPLTATSFFPAKPLGCYGDGGAVFCKDGDEAAVLRSIRVHGQGASRYEHARVGLTGRLDTIQAAVLLEKLTLFADEIELRERVARRYLDGLAGSVELPRVIAGGRSVWAQFTIALEGRNRLAAHLATHDIPTAVYYPKPLHRQEPYAAFPVAPDGLPVTEAACGRVLSLPMHPYLDEATQDRIIDLILSAVEDGACRY